MSDPSDFLCCGPLGSARYYKVTISGITGSCPECSANCNCSDLNADYYFDFQDPLHVGECTAYLPLIVECGYAFLVFRILPCGDAEEGNNGVVFTLELSGTGTITPAINIRWRKENIENSLEPQTLDYLDQLGTECTANGSSVAVEPVPPESMAALFEQCFKWDKCATTSANFPELIAPKAATFLRRCCPCGTLDPRDLIPGSTGGNPSCSSGGCSVRYHIERGNVMVQFSPPSGDDWSPIPEFSLNTTTDGDFKFGLRVFSYLSQFIVDGNDLMPESKGVRKCDGTIEVHTCKPPGPGYYYPPPYTRNRLRLNEDDTYTETCSDGFIFDYDADGFLIRITNPSGNVWTLVLGSPVKYIIDPASRRTTFSYDAGTGNIRRMQDSFGRITTLTLDGSSRLTQFITPELCTTAFRYFDADDRLKALISPDGLRTSFAYTVDGLCKRIQQPSGSIYTYQYDNWSKTRVIAPNAAVTTVTHYVSRQIRSVTEPTGLRSSFIYQGRRPLVYVSPSGARTTYAYAALTDKTRGLTEIIAPAGRTTFSYDSGARLKASIDRLGNRTSYVWNGSNLQIAEINALNQRTSFIYNGSGQRKAEINAIGIRTSYVYDSTGNPQAAINPLGQRTTNAYTFGQLSKVKTPIGSITSIVYDANNRKKAEIDPLGNRTSILYDSCSAPRAIIQPGGARTTNVYSFGRLAARIDPLGNRTSQTYDSLSRQVRVTSPLGRITTTLYDLGSRPFVTIDSAALRTTTIYDSAGRTKATLAPTGVRTTLVYSNAFSNPIAEIAANGSRTTQVYNAEENLVRTQQPTGAITTTIYDRLNRQTAMIDPFGKRTTTVYDSVGRTVANVNALSQRSTMIYNVADQNTVTLSPLGRRNSFVYDVASRRVAQLDARGNRWTTVYDLASRTTASIDPMLRRTSTIYNVNSRPIARVNAAGHRATTVYDVAQREVASIDPAGNRSTTVYNADNQTVANINALGNRTTSVYDNSGRAIAAINARGNRSTTLYDSKGRSAASVNPLANRWTTLFDSMSRPVATKDPLSNRITTVYDSYGRSVARINPLGQRTTSVFNSADQALATIDARGHRTSLVYDSLGREIAQINPLGNRNTSVFDADGKQVALIDARGNRQSFTYDAAGAQTQQIDSLGRRTTLAYDAGGQQTLRLDARGVRTTYTFSPLSQVTSRKYPDGSRATFTYDSRGNRTLMADNTGRYSFSYDALNQTAAAKNPQGKSLTYTYDAIGSRRSMNTDSGRFTYSYDAAQQNTSVINPFGERTTFAFDASGRLTTRRLSNGTRTSYTYDAASRQTLVDNRTSAGVAIAGFTYKYDSVGNPTSMAESSGGRVTWSYDSANRLLSERRSGATSYANTFTYDSVGNRTLTNANTVRTTFNYDVANQLQYSQTAAGRTTFSFDSAGNQRIEQPPTGNRTTTTWNYENQPTQYQLPDASRVTLSYNADNRRVSKVVGSVTSKFIWDPVADAYHCELDAANALNVIYTSPSNQFGQMISQRRGSTSRWYHPDSLGSTRALTDASQATTDTYLYDAWGNPLSSTGTTINPFRWVGNVGYYFDQESGLYYIRARVYQPSIARWISPDPLFYMLAKAGILGYGSRDPIGIASSEFSFTQDSVGFHNGWNLCEYVSGNPMSRVDSSGLKSILPDESQSKCVRCCCCPLKITISRGLYGTVLGGQYVARGWVRYLIDLEFSNIRVPAGSKPKPADVFCSLEFWELPYSTIPNTTIAGGLIPSGMANGVWTDQVELNRQSKFFDFWEMSTHPKQLCETKKGGKARKWVALVDEPKILKAAGARFSYFYSLLRITGSAHPMCACKPIKVQKIFHGHLDQSGWRDDSSNDASAPNPPALP